MTTKQELLKKEFERYIKQSYKHERLFGRGESYARAVIDTHWKDFQEDGRGLISHHESCSGEARFYFRCEVCGFICDRPTKYKNHETREPYPHICDDCLKGAKNDLL